MKPNLAGFEILKKTQKKFLLTFKFKSVLRLLISLYSSTDSGIKIEPPIFLHSLPASLNANR